MSAFGSSVINKSNKKLAPRVPAQRRRALAPSLQHEAASQDLHSDVVLRTRSLADAQTSDNCSDAANHRHTNSSSNTISSIAERQSIITQQGSSEHLTRDFESNATSSSLYSTASVEQNERSTSLSSQFAASERPSKRRRVQVNIHNGASPSPDTNQRPEYNASEMAQPPLLSIDPGLERELRPGAGRQELDISHPPYGLRNRKVLNLSTQNAEIVQRPSPMPTETRPDSTASRRSHRKHNGDSHKARNVVSKRPVPPTRLEGHAREQHPQHEEVGPDGETTVSNSARTAIRKRSRALARLVETSNNHEHRTASVEQDFSSQVQRIEDEIVENDGPSIEAAGILTELNFADDVGRRGRRRHRKGTPEGAADAEIDTSTKRMFDLCKNSKLGKKSKLEAEFQNIDWSEVARLRKEAEEQKRAGDVDREASAHSTREQARDDVRSLGPQLKIVNGQITIDNSSLMVSTHQRSNQIDEEIGNAVLETDLTKRINSRTWLNDTRRDPEERFRSSNKSQPWTEEETERFYDAMRMFGTDFCMISTMFPGRTRRHIKLKYVREERADLNKVDAALGNESVPMSMEKYCEATGQQEDTFKDPKELENELRAEHEKQKAEIEMQRKEQEEAQKQKQHAAVAAAKEGAKNNTNIKTGAKSRKRKPAETNRDTA